MSRRTWGFLLIGIFIVLSAILVYSTPAHAQSSDLPCPPESGATGYVEVLERNADIYILENGDVRYLETWVVDFRGTGFRFAFRDIPLNRVTAIANWSISEGGNNYENQYRGENVFNVENDADSSRVTWCFSSTSGRTRTFTLEYTVVGSLGIYEDKDRYFWKFIEADRGYIIQRANVRVHLPASVSEEDLELAGYTSEWDNLNIYPPGSDLADVDDKAAASITDRQTIMFAGGPFYSGEEWEIGVRFPHGLVYAEPQAWQQLEDNAPFISLALLCGTGILILVGGLGLYLFWYQLGRDRPVGIQAEFIPRPPENVSPGLAGVLLDEMADIEDITSSVVDLARRGYLQIIEFEKSGFGKKSDFEFVRSEKPTTNLRPYEVEVLKAVFKNHKRRELSEMKNKFYSSLPKIRDLMYEEVTSLGYFSGNPEKVRQKYGCFGGILFAVVGLVAWVLFGIVGSFSASVLAFCLPVSCLVFPVGLMVMAKFMPRKTDKGARSAAQWEAFKRYLNNIEKYASVEDAKDKFDQFLPYAIAFGVEKSWVKNFEKTDVLIPGWYQPFPVDTYGPVSGGRGLARPTASGSEMPSLDNAAGRMFGGLESMSTGLFTMLDQAASTFTSAPQSSGGGGGFSGGGFSGGGGGGGGSSGFG